MRTACLLLLFCSIEGFSRGDDDFRWLPVTAADWSLPRDSAVGNRDAVMLFEKVLADDSAMKDREFLLRVYRRIKIFTPAGRSWADVTLPFVPDQSRVTKIFARTHLPDGTVLEMSKEKILERDIVKADEGTVREMFFSLPGVTDSCIIEYCYTYENTRARAIWSAQKEIRLLEGEYRWKYSKYMPSGRFSIADWLFGVATAPNYLWVNSPKPLDIKTLPEHKEAEEAVFTIKDLPAFQSEPFSLPDESVQAHLIRYYGSMMDANSYWTYVSAQVKREVEEFCSDQDRAKALAQEFSSLPTQEEKVVGVYRWLQANIRNITYASKPGRLKSNENANDVIERKYGTQENINYLFWSVANELGVHPKLFYVSKRDRWIFYGVAKFWQFDHCLVVVEDSLHRMQYYSPGDALAEPRQFPWYYEGSTALVAGVSTGEKLFAEPPMSRPENNLLLRTLRYSLFPEQALRCSVRELFTGHQARRLKLLLREAEEAERQSLLKQEIKGTLSQDWGDSLTITSVEMRPDSVLLAYELVGPPLEADATGKIVFRPFGPFAPQDDPFVAERRKLPITFDYASSVRQTVTATLPKGFSANILPPPVQQINTVGTIELIPTLSGDSLVVSTREILSQPLFSTNLYSQVKAFTAARAGMHEVAVIMREKPKKGK